MKFEIELRSICTFFSSGRKSSMQHTSWMVLISNILSPSLLKLCSSQWPSLVNGVTHVLSKPSFLKVGWKISLTHEGQCHCALADRSKWMESTEHLSIRSWPPSILTALESKEKLMFWVVTLRQSKRGRWDRDQDDGWMDIRCEWVKAVCVRAASAVR